MLKEVDNRRKERLQFLYWLKTGYIKTIGQGAKLSGRFRDTIGEWVKKYETGGLEELLTRRVPKGIESQIKGKTFEELKAKVESPEGFNSYFEIQTWLRDNYALEVSYHTAFYVVHHKLNSSPKVPRPRNPKQEPQAVDAFKKTLKKRLNRSSR